MKLNSIFKDVYEETLTLHYLIYTSFPFQQTSLDLFLILDIISL